ncbi:hypothetical protein ACFQ08_41745, partial [Streptosporangium algeriense]
VTGPSADLWSLGATLYSAVEGRPPSPGGSLDNAGMLGSVLFALLSGDPGQRPEPGVLRNTLLDLSRNGGHMPLPPVRADAVPPPSPWAAAAPFPADLPSVPPASSFPSDPFSSDPLSSEPLPSDPLSAETLVSGPSEAFSSGPFSSGPFTSGPLASGPFTSGPFGSDPFSSGPTGPSGAPEPSGRPGPPAPQNGPGNGHQAEPVSGQRPPAPTERPGPQPNAPQPGPQPGPQSETLLLEPPP